MKKFLSVFLTAALAVSMLAGCGSKNETVTAKVIDIDLTNEEYAFGVDKNQPELLEKTNEFIAKIKSDGTLDEICKKYFSDGEPEAVKSATLDASKDQLVVATMQHSSHLSIQRVKIIMESTWRLQSFLLMNLEKSL